MLVKVVQRDKEAHSLENLRDVLRRFNWFRGEPWRKEVIPPTTSKIHASIYTVTSENTSDIPTSDMFFHSDFFHLKMLVEH